MKFVIHMVLIALLAFVFSLFLPWWAIALAAFAISFFREQKAGAAFLAGFLAIALLWGVHAFLLNQANGGLLAGKMGALFGGLSPILLVLVTALIGGLVGGLGSWSGVLAKKLF